MPRPRSTPRATPTSIPPPDAYTQVFARSRFGIVLHINPLAMAWVESHGLTGMIQPLGRFDVRLSAMEEENNGD